MVRKKANIALVLAFLNKGRVFVLHVLTHKDYDTGKWKADCGC
jgi:hypothetical protein